MQALKTAGAPRFRYAGLTLKGVAGDGRFSGYASLFGEVDLGRDAIEPGAFAASLTKRGADAGRALCVGSAGGLAGMGSRRLWGCWVGAA